MYFAVETIGDCFMAATGLVNETPLHALDLVRFGRAMIAAAAEVGCLWPKPRLPRLQGLASWHSVESIASRRPGVRAATCVAPWDHDKEHYGRPLSMS